MEKKQIDHKAKFFSRRWIITIWCCLNITLIIVLGSIFKSDAFAGVAMTLSAVPAAFCSLETVNKWKRKPEPEEKETESNV